MNMNTTAPYSFRVLLIAAALSLLTAFNHYYVGEEAIFPITSMEMWQHGTWLKQYLYGADVRHNPLFNWLIIVGANLFGWTHVLEVARGLTIGATLATAAVLYWLVWRLFAERNFALFAALVYLTFDDVLMYHGWLAYVDPLFALFIFAAIAALWIACAEQRRNLFWVAALSLTCAFLSKAFTAYVFYGIALLVLARIRDYRKLLLGPVSLAAHATIPLAALAWFALIPAGHSQSGRMFAEILAKLAFPDLGEYAAKLLQYPLEIWSGLLPAGALVIYFALRGRITQKETRPEHFRDALLIAALNFLPYWLAPHSGVRYLMPVYPLFALIAARLIWRAGAASIDVTRRWLVAAIAFNLMLGLVAFPYYQHRYRGENYALAASDILARTHGQPLYITDSTTNGLNVTAYINQQRYPQRTLQYPPQDLESGFIISMTPAIQQGETVKAYQLGGDKLYLLCRGTACARGLPIE
ncbi:MAG: dolichyl-phosphate-mannose--protein mannosyltransferase [Nitrosomonadales bacterium]|nr:dolichyl-phosphate-mannose--protein mannosyltransferase [Nitrosomonadales bacterium]